MTIKTQKGLIYALGQPAHKYTCCDGFETFDLEEAVEHDNKLHERDIKEVVPEQIWSMQQAINMAIAEDRVVRFVSKKSGKELKKEIVDLKGCKMMKPSKESDQIAVIPPSVTDFVF